MEAASIKALERGHGDLMAPLASNVVTAVEDLASRETSTAPDQAKPATGTVALTETVNLVNLGSLSVAGAGCVRVVHLTGIDG